MPGPTNKENKPKKDSGGNQGGLRVKPNSRSTSTAVTASNELNQQQSTPQASGSKRPLEKSSPTNESPPQSRQRTETPPLDLAVFTNMLVDALRDPRVSEVLHEYWTDAVHSALADTNTRIDYLEREVNESQSKLQKAEAMIDELEQYSRRNALRIWFPQPETGGEDTDKLVLDYAQKVGVEVKSSEIGRSHRVGSLRGNRSKPRAVIVKFTTYNTRRKLYDARKICPDVFVSEDLTQSRSKVFYNARLERRAGRFLHVWTRDGRINIRLHDNTIKVITLMSELDSLVDQTPISSPRSQGNRDRQRRDPHTRDNSVGSHVDPERSFAAVVMSPSSQELDEQ